MLISKYYIKIEFLADHVFLIILFYNAQIINATTIITSNTPTSAVSTTLPTASSLDCFLIALRYTHANINGIPIMLKNINTAICASLTLLFLLNTLYFSCLI